MYNENQLDLLIKEAILSVKDLPYVSQFANTVVGRDRIFDRVKQHILVRGITNLDTALALVESELSTPNID
jgi:hypothetical protein